jgi:hypothetical protein
LQKKYIIRLNAEERKELEAMVKNGKAAAYKIKHANILLADRLVALEVVDSISEQTVRRTLKKTNYGRICRSAG